MNKTFCDFCKIVVIEGRVIRITSDLPSEFDCCLQCYRERFGEQK